MNWTEILANAGVPEPPGYRETVDAIKADPYRTAKEVKRDEKKAAKESKPPAVVKAGPSSKSRRRYI
jgi:hypothetical protein